MKRVISVMIFIFVASFGVGFAAVLELPAEAKAGVTDYFAKQAYSGPDLQSQETSLSENKKQQVISFIHKSVPTTTLAKIRQASEYRQTISQAYQFTKVQSESVNLPDSTELFIQEALTSVDTILQDLKTKESVFRILFVKYLLSFGENKAIFKEKINTLWEQMVQDIAQAKQLLEEVINVLKQFQ